MTYFTSAKQGVSSTELDSKEAKNFKATASPGKKATDTMHSAKAAKSRKQIRPRI